MDAYSQEPGDEADRLGMIFLIGVTLFACAVELDGGTVHPALWAAIAISWVVKITLPRNDDT